MRAERDNRLTLTGSAMDMISTIMVMAAADLRKDHDHPLIGIAISILRNAALILTFWAVSGITGLSGYGIRGDSLLFVVTGIFIFQIHVTAMMAVTGAMGSPQRASSNIVQEARILGAAIASLVQQIISMVVLLFLYDALWAPLVIDRPEGLLLCMILAWGSGVGLGMVFGGMTTWKPALWSIASQVWSRVNMIAAGSMFVVNTLPASMRPWLDWNPLLHITDQARTAAFLHYDGRFTTLAYGASLTVFMIVVGSLIQFHFRKTLSPGQI